MLRSIFVAALTGALQFSAFAGPKEDAQAVADKFVAAFVAGNADTTLALFAPDASFWGTVSPDLAVTPEAVRKYFADNYAGRPNVPLKEASITDSSAQVLSADTVLISGRWQIENARGSFPLRYTFVMHRKDGQWRIVHLHSSPRPRPPN
jgi:uncharacterized protein (TIGR02246 family)